MGLEVTYAYDNLVFVAHNAFLLETSETSPKELNLFFNFESDPAARPKLTELLRQHAEENGLCIQERCLFKLEPQANDTLKITFLA